jgi:hypothetical protein
MKTVSGLLKSTVLSVYRFIIIIIIIIIIILQFDVIHFIFKMRSKNDVSEWPCLLAQWEMTHSAGPIELCLSSSVGIQVKLNYCYACRFQYNQHKMQQPV